MSVCCTSALHSSCPGALVSISRPLHVHITDSAYLLLRPTARALHLSLRSQLPWPPAAQRHRQPQPQPAAHRPQAPGRRRCRRVRWRGLPWPLPPPRGHAEPGPLLRLHHAGPRAQGGARPASGDRRDARGGGGSCRCRSCCCSRGWHDRGLVRRARFHVLIFKGQQRRRWRRWWFRTSGWGPWQQWLPGLQCPDNAAMGAQSPGPRRRGSCVGAAAVAWAAAGRGAAATRGACQPPPQYRPGAGAVLGPGAREGPCRSGCGAWAQQQR